MATSEPVVTVLIINYNGSKYLPDCVGSVLKTSYPRMEILVVDNASTDDSLSILNEFTDSRLRVILNKANLGFAAGNNFGYSRSNGKYVVFLNNDTKVDPEWLTALVKAFEADSSVGAAQSKLLSLHSPTPTFDSAGDFLDHFCASVCRAKGMPDHDQYNKMEEVFSGRGAALMIKRDAVQGYEPFDPDFFMQFEDVDLCWRLHLRGFKVVYVPASIVYHAGRGTPSEHRLYHGRKNVVQLFLKNYDFANIIRYFPESQLFRFLEILRDVKANNWKAFKTKVSAYVWVSKNMRNILLKRSVIQMSRKVSDEAALKLMLKTSHRQYFGFMMKMAQVEENVEKRDLLQYWYFQRASNAVFPVLGSRRSSTKWK